MPLAQRVATRTATATTSNGTRVEVIYVDDEVPVSMGAPAADSFLVGTGTTVEEAAAHAPAAVASSPFADAPPVGDSRVRLVYVDGMAPGLTLGAPDADTIRAVTAAAATMVPGAEPAVTAANRASAPAQASPVVVLDGSDSDESPAAAQAPPVVWPDSSGNDKSLVPSWAMRMLPAFQVTAAEAERRREKPCTICLHEFEEGQEVRRLACMCLFHCEEIDEWLSRKDSCPVHVTRTVVEYLGCSERVEATE